MLPLQKYVPNIHAYFKTTLDKCHSNHSMILYPHVKLLFVASLKGKP